MQPISQARSFAASLTLLLVVVSMSVGTTGFAQSKSEYYTNYIARYSGLAVSEMERAGVPASIKLAQGLLECNAGRSTLAVQANNHFGIKCAGGWTGDSYYLKDDDRDANGTLIESCFRKYTDPESSYIDHSEFLRDPKKTKRYGFLFFLDRRDYRAWANGLRQSGYATEQRYADLLIAIIEEYQLYRFDVMNSSTAGGAAPSINQTGVIVNNDVKMVLARQGETPTGIAARYDISIKKLLSYNEGLRNANQLLDANERVYLQKKKGFFRGKKLWHYVQEGETMYSISQLYGVRLKTLYCRNRMKEGTEPAIGERIKLRWRVRKDQVPRLNTEVRKEDIRVKPPTQALPPDEGHNDNLQMILDREKFDENYEFELPKDTPSPTTRPQKPTSPTTPSKPQPPTKTDTNTPTAGQYHTVQSGETLYGIAKKYNLTVEKLKSWNNLTNNTISAGQRLRVQ